MDPNDQGRQAKRCFSERNTFEQNDRNAFWNIPGQAWTKAKNLMVHSENNEIGL